jgi:2-polyprenyl-3-methyl-5-hydroxy-6-metoxy-1,4-benzoquinol methylase
LFKKIIYILRYLNELRVFGRNKNIHDLPDIFHYWSNKYLLPKSQSMGFDNPEDFFFQQCKKYCLKNHNMEKIKIISIGSGNGEFEVSTAKRLVDSDITNFSIECMDINARMHKRTQKLAEIQNVAEYITTLQQDFNKWQSTQKYDVVMANQSLHHVVELEHLFDSIITSLEIDGKFIVFDMIGRNGHMRWPEALTLVQKFWQELPKEYTYNNAKKRFEKSYINYDCSTRSFEGIRAQDIMPLLLERFEFELFLPFANIVTIFIDRIFGLNFDPNIPFDTDFIDRVHAADEAAILSGEITPTQMYAVMKKPNSNSQLARPILLDPKLTPEYCVRNTQRIDD